MIIDVVLLSGKQGSGKSTTAGDLEELALITGYDAVTFRKFAGPLYDLHDAVLDQMEIFTGQPRVIKDGELLQWLGTEWGRNKFGADVWVSILKRELQQFKDGCEKLGYKKGLVIIDDCRFENEFEALPEALRVRLNADERTRKERMPPGTWRFNVLHPSEVSLDLYDLEGRFDLYLQTDAKDSSPRKCAIAVFERLVKRDWIERRRDKDGFND